MSMGRDESALPLYRDEELERLLKESKERNYAQITQLLDRVQQHFNDAQARYLKQDTAINLAVRNYYFTILWEYIVSFFYYCAFRTSNVSSSTQMEIEQRKKELDDWLTEQKEIYQKEITLLRDKSKELSQLKETIATMESDLAVIEMVIQSFDKDLQATDSILTAEERAAKTNLLSDYVAQRDALTKGIIELYQKIDAEMAALMDIPGLSEIKSYVNDKIYKEAHIKALLIKCASINHPVADKLRSLLTNRTDISAKSLRSALLSYPDYLENRVLADAVWDASVYFPKITADLQREDEVLKFIQAQEDKLVVLQTQIELLDAAYRKKPHQDIPERLQEMQGHKRELSQLIHTVLLANKESMTDSESRIHQKLDNIAESRMTEDAISRLRVLCERITHPIAKELQHYLTYQTTTSLHTLEKLLETFKDVQKDPALANLLWEVGQLFTDLQILDPNNPKQVIVARIEQLDEQLENAAGLQHSLKAEMDELKTEIVHFFDGLIQLERKKVSIEIAQIQNDLAIIDKELKTADSVQKPELEKLKDGLTRLLQAEKDSLTEFGMSRRELHDMRDRLRTLGSSYFPREHLKILKDKYPAQYQQFQGYQKIKQSLSTLEQSIQSQKRQKETYTEALEKFSTAQYHSVATAHAAKSDQNTYMDFFRSQLDRSRKALGPNIEPEPGSQKPRNLK